MHTENTEDEWHGNDYRNTRLISYICNTSSMVWFGGLREEAGKTFHKNHLLHRNLPSFSWRRHKWYIFFVQEFFCSSLNPSTAPLVHCILRLYHCRMGNGGTQQVLLKIRLERLVEEILVLLARQSWRPCCLASVFSAVCSFGLLIIWWILLLVGVLSITRILFCVYSQGFVLYKDFVWSNLICKWSIIISGVGSCRAGHEPESEMGPLEVP